MSKYVVEYKDGTMEHMSSIRGVSRYGERPRVIYLDKVTIELEDLTSAIVAVTPPPLGKVTDRYHHIHDMYLDKEGSIIPLDTDVITGELAYAVGKSRVVYNETLDGGVVLDRGAMEERYPEWLV